jgi:hypothetical protein
MNWIPFVHCIPQIICPADVSHLWKWTGSNCIYGAMRNLAKRFGDWTSHRWTTVKEHVNVIKSAYDKLLESVAFSSPWLSTKAASPMPRVRKTEFLTSNTLQSHSSRWRNDSHNLKPCLFPTHIQTNWITVVPIANTLSQIQLMWESLSCWSTHQIFPDRLECRMSSPQLLHWPLNRRLFHSFNLEILGTSVGHSVASWNSSWHPSQPTFGLNGQCLA